MESKTATLELFNQLLSRAVEMGSSDIIIKSGEMPSMRVDGKIVSLGEQVLFSEQILDFIDKTIPSQIFQKWARDMQVDYSYPLPDGCGAFRINAFQQRGEPAIVFRYIVGTPPSYGDLDLDGRLIETMCSFCSGIAVLCGPTGSGKSSTLAAIINEINETQEKHVITLEDPIEFIHRDKKSVISQREVGVDAPSFCEGLKSAMRQNPDIILVGEMRDAETGHYVLSTLHAHNARQAVQRLLDFFPESELEGRCRQISGSLKAVLCQSLIKRKEEEGRVPATEAFIVEGIGKSLLAKGNLRKIPDFLEAGSSSGSRSLNADLYRLIRLGLVSKEDAMVASPNPKALDLRLKGIQLQRGQILD